MEEEFWKPKLGVRWLKDGDRNTMFFHSYVKGRRKKLHISEILDEQGRLMNTEAQIGDAAVRYFESQFIEDNNNDDFSMLEHITSLIMEEENKNIIKLPGK